MTNLRDIPGEHSQQVSLNAVAAADATEEQIIFVAPEDCRLKEVAIIPNAAVTGNTTNTKHLNVLNKGSGGAGTTELGNLDLATGTNLADSDRQVIVTSLTTDLTKGDVIALEIEDQGSGVAIPESLIEVRYDYLN